MMRFLNSRSPVHPLVIAAGALLSAACSSTSPSTSTPVRLSVMAHRAVPTPARRGLSADVAIGTGANSLNITNVDFVLARTELSDAGTCSIPPANNDNCDELEIDPLLIDLPLDGTPPQKVLDALVPPGTYTRLQAELNAVQPGEGETGAAAFLAAHPDWAGLSVQVTGDYTDASSTVHHFTFTSGVDAQIEIPFASPVTVDPAKPTSNITLTVDVAKWFTDGVGAAIDPTNPANADAINANIKSSFEAFQDNNEDGVADQQGAA
ncbi:MAG TPA: hypothetical protein VIV10_06570 [Gemmatimonadales bacterium]